MEKKTWKLSLVLWLLLTASLVVIVFFFNDKMNRMHKIQLKAVEEIKSDIAYTLTSKTSEEKSTSGSKNREVTYKFPSLVPEKIDTYKPQGKYFTWSLMKNEADLVDENGVLMTYRKEIDGNTYHPVAIAQYGLDQYGNYIESGDDKFFVSAKVQADFLVDSLNAVTGLLPYQFDFHVGGTKETLKAPWSSAMAQGQAISLFSRVFDVTKDKKYLEACALAIRPLNVKVSEGGLLQYFQGHKYYEEYPTILPNYTLNGFMFALIGLYDTWVNTGSEEAGRAYKEGIETLILSLPYYDSVGISLYHLGHLNVGENLGVHYAERYHLVHVHQLRVINQHENNDVIEYYINRWTSYVNK